MAGRSYALVAGKTGDELVDGVNGLMGQGWAPVGGPLAIDQEGEAILLQAVVLPPKPKSRKQISISDLKPA